MIREFTVWANIRKKPTVEDFWKIKQKDWKEINVKDLHSVLDALHGSEILNKDLIKIIRSLRKNYKVGILSNVGGDVTKLLKSRFKVADIFDFNLGSGEIELAKPDSMIFQHLIGYLNLNPEEIVFIDDRKENVASAEKLGIRSILFTNKDKLKLELRNIGVNQTF